VKLEGKVALITGAGSGIGQAIALRFATEGADIAVNDIDLQSAEKTAIDLEKIGRRAIAVQADVAEENQLMPWWKTIKELGGYIF
jgi:NAD(P)-dependent dehydrogenase (short-subunit alcohol dehydrogenase family)